MAEWHDERTSEQDNARHAVKRRGLVAGAAALIAGFALKQSQGSAPVGATNGDTLFLGGVNVSPGNTSANVIGYFNDTAPPFGVWAIKNTGQADAVRGQSFSGGAAGTAGVRGEINAGSLGSGVIGAFGTLAPPVSSGNGVYGYVASGSGNGVLGVGPTGVQGTGSGSNSVGVEGVSGATPASIGVKGTGTAFGVGVQGSPDDAGSVGVLGLVPSTSTAATTKAVRGFNQSANGGGVGVEGASTAGIGGQFSGGKAQMRLVPQASGTGAPTSGAHAVGEFYADSTGAVFYCRVAGTPGTWEQLMSAPGPFLLGAVNSSAATTQVNITSASGPLAALLGVSNVSANGIGVSGQGDGIIGVGVLGTANGTSGIAVKGNATAGTGIRGSSLGTSASDGNGVFGFVHHVGSTQVTAGVFGDSDASYGIIGRTTAAGYSGCTGIANTPNTAAFAGAGTGGAICAFFTGPTVVQGDFTVVGGQKNAAVKHSDGSYRLLHCIESPESWFEDFGETKLVGGRADVKLDADFVAVVDTEGYRVFLTPEGDSKGLYVTAKAAGGFSVREQQGGTASIVCAWRVVARRKDIKVGRMAKFDLPKIKLPRPDELPTHAPPAKP